MGFNIGQDIWGGVGSFLNELTGVSGSARQQYNYNQQLQAAASTFNSAEAQKERDWQTDMSNSAHQRAVADLQAAGINPVLAAGSPASSGAGAVATSPGGSTGAGTSAANPIQEVLNAITTAKDIEKIDAEIDNIDANTDYTDTLTQNAGTKTTSMKNDEDFANTWWGRNISPALRDIFGNGSAASGAVAGAAASQAVTSAKKARTPRRRRIGFQ